MEHSPKRPWALLECPGIFSGSQNWSVSKNREMYSPENFCMKRTSPHIKHMWIKQLCDHKVWNFSKVFHVRKLFGTFEEWAPWFFHKFANHRMSFLVVAFNYHTLVFAFVAFTHAWLNPFVNFYGWWGTDQRQENRHTSFLVRLCFLSYTLTETGNINYFI